MTEPCLNSTAKKFVEMLKKEDNPPLYDLSPDDARIFLRNLQRKSHKEIEADTRDINIFTPIGGNVDIRVIRPKNNHEKLPAILYVHGGGWILGDKEVYDMPSKKLADETNSVVIFVDYTKSPEAKYPTALNQIYGVLMYITENHDEFNIFQDKIAIAGDSAGGNMAAATAIRAKKENGPKIVSQVLIYPVTDADMNSKSYDDFKNGPWLTKKAMEWFFNAYISDKKQQNDIYVSPLKADLEDLKGLPPALIITDENDILRDEGEAYARKLDAAGVDTMSVRINGTFHDFFMLNALAGTASAKGAMLLVSSFLQKALH